MAHNPVFASRTFQAAPKGGFDTRPLTVENTVHKTFALFGILVAAAVGGWMWTLSPAPSAPTMLPLILGTAVGFILAMVVIFTSRRKIRPGIIVAYAAFEGLAMGAISAYFEVLFPGIVLQAALATLAVIAVTLALFASGKVRASAKATKVFLVAMVGYLIFAVLNMGLMWLGVIPGDMMFGMYSAKLFGFLPVGLIIGVLVVIMAAYSLVLDFDDIQKAVQNQVPQQYAWMGAFGIMVTVVWLYVEMLRIVAIVRGSD